MLQGKKRCRSGGKCTGKRGLANGGWTPRGIPQGHPPPWSHFEFLALLARGAVKCRPLEKDIAIPGHAGLA